MSLQGLGERLDEKVEDASEETFLLFSQNIPSQNLGFVDGQAENLELDVGGRSFVLRQSPGILTSSREAGTTGAVLWKITPLVAEWLASMPELLTSANILHPQVAVIELGCGITGLIGMLLAPKVASYTLTDQKYVMKLLRENIHQNTTSIRPRVTRGRDHPRQASGSEVKSPRTIALDWETDTVSVLNEELASGHCLLIVCDCVYNEYLIKPLVDTLVDACRQAPSLDKPTTVLIAQQLRSDSIFELFLETMLAAFQVWRVPSEYLPAPLSPGSGYVIHLAQLKKL